MLSRLAHWCFRRHWLTIIIWLVALFGGSTIANQVIGGGAFETRFSIPNTESLRALNLLQDAFPDTDTITDAINIGMVDGFIVTSTSVLMPLSPITLPRLSSIVFLYLSLVISFIF